MSEDYVGARIRSWRHRRGISQRALADLAGVSQPYVSAIESGTKEIDRVSTLNRIATALKVSVADLSGQPFAPVDADHSHAQEAVPEVRAALISLAYMDLPETPTRALAELENATTRLMHYRRVCEYAEATQLIASLLRDLGAAAYASKSRSKVKGRRLLALATYNTAFVLKYLGFVDLSIAAAECCHEAARDLTGEWAGLAEYARLHTLPSESRAIGRRLATDTIDMLGAQLNSSAIMQTYGMMHLTNAWTEVLEGNIDGANGHLDEAAAVAAQLGDEPRDGGFAQLYFGPTNVEHWRMSLALEAGESGRAVELARTIRPEAIASKSRRATFHIETGRALAAGRRHDAEALAQFVNAERVAPQRVRLSPVVRETVGAMLRRARADAGGQTLRGLASRVGVA